MATSYTTLLGFALPVQGELNGTWGNTVNNSITQLCEDSIAGVATQSVLSADWTLTTTGSGAANQARMAILIPTGAPGVSRNIIAPAKSKIYTVINQSNANVVIKGAATTGVTIAAGDKVTVVWNGSDFVNIVTTGAAGTFTNLTYTGTLTGSTGIMNIGSGQLYKDASGNVGVGTSSPFSAAGYGALTINGSTGSILSAYSAGAETARLQSTATSTSFGTITALPLQILTSNTERMRIDSTGKVGIATASPATTLDVNGSIRSINNVSPTSGSGLELLWTGTVGLVQTYNRTTPGFLPTVLDGSYVAVQISGAERMRIDSAGNVGVGTSSPSAKLHVNGNIVQNAAIAAWNAPITVNQINVASIWNNGPSTVFGHNTVFGTSYAATRISAGYASTIGMSLDGAGSIDFSVAGTDIAGSTPSFINAMRINSAGNVGIGTVSPSTKLSVLTSISNAGISVNDGTVNTILYNTNSLNGTVGTTTNHPMGFYANNAERMRIDSSGNVMIATTSSTETFKVGAGAADTRATFRPNTPYAIGVANGAAFAGWIGGSGVTDNMVFSNSGGTERMRIDSSGNVGIGTTSPGYKLHVRNDSASASNWVVSQNGTATGSFGSGFIGLIGTAGTNYFALYQTGNGDTVLSNNTSTGVIALGTNAGERMRIHASGGISIGNITDPGATNLSVTGTVTTTTQAASDSSTKAATTAFVKSVGIGWGQTWATFTSSTRAIGTNYTNSTGKPILVTFAGPMNISSGTASATVDGVNVGTFGGGTAFSCHENISFIVPNGSTYSISGNIQYGTWAELR